MAYTTKLSDGQGRVFEGAIGECMLLTGPGANSEAVRALTYAYLDAVRDGADPALRAQLIEDLTEIAPEIEVSFS